jgi:4-diphosphocytidyl-2-C-methyl-D-erythritol kinase
MVNPDLHVSTAEAYGGLQGFSAEPDLKKWLQKPLPEWQGNIRNDFEASIFQKYPAIAAVKEKLYEIGAQYASMSGSGATVFGIFDSETQVKEHFPLEYEVKGDWL